MLVTVEGSLLPLPVITGTDDERVIVLRVKTLVARSFICERPWLSCSRCEDTQF
jgi:hypothetical protein